MEIDTLGTFVMSRAAYPALRQGKQPCVINISATLHYGATWWQVRVCACVPVCVCVCVSLPQSFEKATSS